MASASVGLSMAIISIAKLLLFVLATFTLLLHKPSSTRFSTILKSRTVFWILLAISTFSASLFWTVAPEADALGSLAKYGKLLSIILVMMLIRDRREALCALAAFALAQLFLVTSAWLLFVHLPIPWATSNMALQENAVFSSYLDQGIMAAVFGAICWHLRGLAPGRWGCWAAIFISAFSLLNAVFVLNGRSGHVVAIAVVSLAIMWALPKKFRIGVLAMPLVLFAVLVASSHKVRDRVTQVVSEVGTYSSQPKVQTSSGIRLKLWGTALDSIANRPVVGSGVGSWSTEYNRIQRQKNPSHTDIQGNGNPHQEYLQWGVQLGLPGIALLLALMFAILRDSQSMDVPSSRALQTVVLALAVACLFNSSLYDALIGDFFCVLIGLLMAWGLHSGPKEMDARLVNESTMS